MASVNSRTQISIDELVNSTVTGGSIDASGNLILTTRGGASLVAGNVVPQLGVLWSSSTNYALGNITGYAGSLWKATAPSLNKPPALNTNVWTQITSRMSGEWAERDPYFSGNDVGSNGPWEFFWKSGSPVVSLTSVAGEFDLGYQALKIALAPGEFQRLHAKYEENIVTGGEVIVTRVRAKLLSAASGVTLTSSLLQNLASTPTPLAAGVSTTVAAEGSQTLTTSWNTYTFTHTAVSGKPRAQALISAIAPAGVTATVLIDYILTTKSNGFGLAAYPVGSIYKSVLGTNPSLMLGGGTWVAWGTGRTPVGISSGETEFNTVEKTGGFKTHALTVDELPSHSHTGLNGHTSAYAGGGSNAVHFGADPPSHPGYFGVGWTGSNVPHNNLQPYITCYMWKRTA